MLDVKIVVWLEREKEKEGRGEMPILLTLYTSFGEQSAVV